MFGMNKEDTITWLVVVGLLMFIFIIAVTKDYTDVRAVQGQCDVSLQHARSSTDTVLIMMAQPDCAGRLTKNE